jgi:small conductance mechanosensitive channel
MINSFMNTLIDGGTRFGLKVLGAIVIWVVGRWVIGLVVRFLRRVLTRQHVDPTLLRYLGNMVTVVLNIALAVGILGYFGVETTSFAAVLAGAAIAIGAAWGAYWPTLRLGRFSCCSDHLKPVTSLLRVAQRAPSRKSGSL